MSRHNMHLQTADETHVDIPRDSLPTPALPPRAASPFASRTQSDESWVEVASRPSSSSLSSAAEDIVTTGLYVQNPPALVRQRRRRRLRTQTATGLTTHNTAGASSQEEYEESESDSDKVLTSSGEALGVLDTSADPTSNDTALISDDDDDGNRTAVNTHSRGTRTQSDVFTPRPNAFQQHSQPSPYLVSTGDRRMSSHPGRPLRPRTRHSYSGHEGRAHHSPFNAIYPSSTTATAAQHDAALRASLSTLLSCAAAARGLTKSATAVPNDTSPLHRRQANRIQPATLRLIPESALPGRREPTFLPTIPPGSHATSTSGQSDTPDHDPHKRRATGERSSSKDRRHKKARRSSSGTTSVDDSLFISPTLLTWVVSAGVVAIISALSFSAGYSVGKEAGRLEGGFLVGNVSDVNGRAREVGQSSIGLVKLQLAVPA